MTKDHYETLGIASDADCDAIKKAYRKLARQLHPDINRSANASDKMSAVNEAYEILADEGRRASYDASHRTGLDDAPRAKSSQATAFARHHLSIVDLPSPAYSVGMSIHRDELAIGCFDNTVRFASAKTGRSFGEVQLEGGAVSAVRWTGRTRLVAAGVSEKSVSVWQLRDRKVVSSFAKRADWISPIAISPSGDFVVMGSVHKVVTCLDAITGETRFEKKRHDDAVSAVAISSNATVIASGGNDQRVILWMSNGLERAEIGPLRAAVASLAFSPDGSQLAVGLIDHGIRIFDLQNGSLRTTLWGHEKALEGMSFHPSGWLLASGSREGSTRLWNTQSGKALDVLGGHTEPIKSVAFSPSGSYLAAGGLDRVISIWRVAV